MTRFCANCDEIREVRTERRRETYPVRGEPVEVEAEVLVCTACGRMVFDRAQDERTLRAAYGLYRQRHGLLKPEEIRSLRERYGLSQRSLARLLGWGLVTIQRYEQGALQEPAHDQVLRNLEDPHKVLELLERHGHRVPERVREHIREKALRAADAVQPERLAREVERLIAVGCERKPVLHGFRVFDLERLGELVSWLAKTCSDPFKTKLAKLLWLCDFAHFRRHRVSITGLAYARFPFGPAPDHFQSLLGALEEVGAVQILEQFAGPYPGEVVVPVEEADLADFTESERQTISLVSERFGHLPAAELSRLSHAESVWADRADGDMIPYTEADRVRMLDAL